MLKVIIWNVTYLWDVSIQIYMIKKNKKVQNSFNLSNTMFEVKIWKITNIWKVSLQNLPMWSRSTKLRNVFFVQTFKNQLQCQYFLLEVIVWKIFFLWEVVLQIYKKKIKVTRKTSNTSSSRSDIVELW